jgi:hypothetical protein
VVSNLGPLHGEDFSQLLIECEKFPVEPRVAPNSKRIQVLAMKLGSR